jgi:hypothetical protein
VSDITAAEVHGIFGLPLRHDVTEGEQNHLVFSKPSRPGMSHAVSLF